MLTVSGVGLCESSFLLLEYFIESRLYLSTQRAGMVYSVSGCTRGVQVKLWDLLRSRAIPKRLKVVITKIRYTNPRLPLLLPLLDW